MTGNSSLALGGDRGGGTGGIGQADFNSINTRNMAAVDMTATNANVEGDITSGRTWNTNGTIRDPNALGGISSRGNDSVRLNGLVATGRIELGGLLQCDSQDKI